MIEIANNWNIFKSPQQAKPGTVMRCPNSNDEFIVTRRGRVEGRVGILIQFKCGQDIPVVEAKNKWFIK